MCRLYGMPCAHATGRPSASTSARLRRRRHHLRRAIHLGQYARETSSPRATARRDVGVYESTLPAAISCSRAGNSRPGALLGRASLAPQRRGQLLPPSPIERCDTTSTTSAAVQEFRLANERFRRRAATRRPRGGPRRPRAPVRRSRAPTASKLPPGRLVLSLTSPGGRVDSCATPSKTHGHDVPAVDALDYKLLSRNAQGPSAASSRLAGRDAARAGRAWPTHQTHERATQASSPTQHAPRDLRATQALGEPAAGHDVPQSAPARGRSACPRLP